MRRIKPNDWKRHPEKYAVPDFVDGEEEEGGSTPVLRLPPADCTFFPLAGRFNAEMEQQQRDHPEKPISMVEFLRFLHCGKNQSFLDRLVTGRKEDRAGSESEDESENRSGSESEDESENRSEDEGER